MILQFKFILYFLYDIKKILLTTFIPSILNFFGREGDPWNLDIYIVSEPCWHLLPRGTILSFQPLITSDHPTKPNHRSSLDKKRGKTKKIQKNKDTKKIKKSDTRTISRLSTEGEKEAELVVWTLISFSFFLSSYGAKKEG